MPAGKASGTPPMLAPSMVNFPATVFALPVRCTDSQRRPFSETRPPAMSMAPIFVTAVDSRTRPLMPDTALLSEFRASISPGTSKLREPETSFAGRSLGGARVQLRSTEILRRALVVVLVRARLDDRGVVRQRRLGDADPGPVGHGCLPAPDGVHVVRETEAEDRSEAQLAGGRSDAEDLRVRGAGAGDEFLVDAPRGVARYEGAQDQARGEDGEQPR